MVIHTFVPFKFNENVILYCGNNLCQEMLYLLANYKTKNVQGYTHCKNAHSGDSCGGMVNVEVADPDRY